MKTVTSFSFLLLGFVNFINNTNSLLIFMGLCYGFIGDIILGCKQIFSKSITLGIISFFIGHVFYLLVIINNISIFNCLIIVILVFLLTLYLEKADFNFSNIKPFCYGYLIISCFLFVISIENLFKDFSTFNTIFVLGIVLFVLSDLFLCHIYFKKPNYILKLFNIGFYYFGQILIALSINWY